MKQLLYYSCLLVIGLTSVDAITIFENVSYGRIAFVIMCVCSFFSLKSLIPPNKFIFKILSIFILYVSISLVWSKYPDLTNERLLYLIQYYIIIVVLYNTVKTINQIYMMLYSYILGAFYIAVYSIIDYIQGSSQLNAEVLYRSENVGNPNENAFLIAYAIVLIFILLKTSYILNSKYLRYSLKVMFPFFLFSFFAMGSRMGMILVLTALFFNYFSNRSKISLKRIFTVFLTLFIPIFIFIHFFVSDSTLDRIINISSDIEGRNFAQREWIWQKTFEMFNDPNFNPIIGNGWGTFSQSFFQATGTLYGAHNFYLTLFYTAGIIGFLIITIYFISLFLKIKKYKVKNKLLYFSLIIIPWLSMLSTNWESRRWWFLIGLFIYKIHDLCDFENETRMRNL